MRLNQVADILEPVARTLDFYEGEDWVEGPVLKTLEKFELADEYFSRIPRPSIIGLKAALPWDVERVHGHSTDSSVAWFGGQTLTVDFKQGFSASLNIPYKTSERLMKLQTSARSVKSPFPQALVRRIDIGDDGYSMDVYPSMAATMRDDDYVTCNNGIWDGVPRQDQAELVTKLHAPMTKIQQQLDSLSKLAMDGTAQAKTALQIRPPVSASFGILKMCVEYATQRRPQEDAESARKVLPNPLAEDVLRACGEIETLALQGLRI